MTKYVTSSSSSSTGGIGLCGMLTVLFVALKLTGYINWSWFWVLAPIWIPATFFFGFAIMLAGVVWFLNKRI